MLLILLYLQYSKMLEIFLFLSFRIWTKICHCLQTPLPMLALRGVNRTRLLTGLVSVSIYNLCVKFECKQVWARVYSFSGSNATSGIVLAWVTAWVTLLKKVATSLGDQNDSVPALKGFSLADCKFHHELKLFFDEITSKFIEFVDQFKLFDQLFYWALANPPQWVCFFCKQITSYITNALTANAVKACCHRGKIFLQFMLSLMERVDFLIYIKNLDRRACQPWNVAVWRSLEIVQVNVSRIGPALIVKLTKASWAIQGY